MDRCENVLAAIDAANARDPRRESGEPEALLYGQRMSAELARLFPEADALLRIAARGQHVERWVLARTDYPEGRAGYLSWRRDLGRHHADRVGEMMRAAGYGDAQIAQVQAMLRKEGIKRDPQVQALEDVACFVFLKWYFTPFAAKHSPEKLRDIVAKTARKMSPGARDRALAEFDLPGDLADAMRA